MTSGPAVQADLLATIVAATRRIVHVRSEREPMERLARRAEARSAKAGRFYTALSRSGTVNVIAECKRRSPSRGVLCADYHPERIASSYEAGGAAAISVLTEPTFFDGSLDDLQAVREVVAIPLLRKDFIVSEYQLFEARANGADAILLIVAALDDAALKRLHARAAELELDVLVEVHDEQETDRAIAAGARIIGVNNRNLKTLEVDVRASERLIARIPREIVAVSESGLKTADDIARLRQLGYRAFLVGERFMVEPDPGLALRRIVET